MHNKATAHVKKEENRKHKTIKSVVKEIINFNLTDEEQAALEYSAAQLKSVLEQVKDI